MAVDADISLSALAKRVAALEAEGQIRRLVARYMELCDQLSPETPLDQLGALFTRDAVWQGGGARYKSAFGGHQGREAIVGFLATYCDPPHFASNVHFLTSEALTVSGDTAEGAWVMLQTPSFACGESFVLAARLTLAFKVEDGCWRISRFQTTNLLGREIEGGWHSQAPIPVPQSPDLQGKDKP